MTALTWIGIFLCIAQAGMFSGLNLAFFSISKLRLEVEAAQGNRKAIVISEMREAANLRLSSIRWGDVAVSVLLTLLLNSLLAGVAAFVTWLALTAIGVPFATPLAIWVGVLSQFVPVFGTYLGGILPVLIALLEDPAKAVWVLGFIVAYQQIENYVIGPRITARTMSLHPAVAFGAVIAGASILGPIGALLALPAAATGQAFVSTYLRRHEVVESRLTQPPKQRVNILRPLTALRHNRENSPLTDDSAETERDTRAAKVAVRYTTADAEKCKEQRQRRQHAQSSNPQRHERLSRQIEEHDIVPARRHLATGFDGKTGLDQVGHRFDTYGINACSNERLHLLNKPGVHFLRICIAVWQ